MFQDTLRQIKHLLHKLGLIESEVTIFLLGLEIGATSVAHLSEESGMGRITVHEIVKRLIQKGLFLETYSGKKRLVYANQLDALEKIVEKERFDLEQKQADAKRAASLLRSIQTQSKRFPKTRFYKGQEGIQIMLEEARKDKKDIAIMSDGQHFYDLIDNNFLEQSLSFRNTYGIKVQLLFPSGFEYFSYTQGTYQQKLDIRSLPHEELLQGGVMIWGSKVALHCYEGRFISSTLLDNRNIAALMSYFFQMTWMQAKAY